MPSGTLLLFFRVFQCGLKIFKIPKFGHFLVTQNFQCSNFKKLKIFDHKFKKPYKEFTLNHPSFHQTFIFLLVSAMWNKLDYFEFFPQWNLLDDARHFRQLGNFLKVPALFNPQVVPSHTLLFVSRCQKCHTENSVTRHETSKNSSNWAWSSFFYEQRSWTHFGFTIMESKMQTSLLAKS